MNGFISIFMRIKIIMENFILIYVVKRNTRNETDLMTDGDRSKTESVLMIVLA